MWDSLVVETTGSGVRLPEFKLHFPPLTTLHQAKLFNFLRASIIPPIKQEKQYYQLHRVIVSKINQKILVKCLELHSKHLLIIVITISCYCNLPSKSSNLEYKLAFKQSLGLPCSCPQTQHTLQCVAWTHDMFMKEEREGRKVREGKGRKRQEGGRERREEGGRGDKLRK